jgi:outer membrane protein TolC
LQESGEAFLLPEKVPVANIGEALISASYQFDLWGTFKRGTEAAKANADAVQAAADTARITLVADVVKAYTQVCSANEEYHIARESLDLQEQSVQLNQRLRDAGRGDETQVTRSQTQFKSLRAELPRFKAERETGMYTLAALLAKPVDQLPAGTADCAELPHLNQLVPVGDGAALLKRRPTCARPSASWRPPPPTSAWPLARCTRTSALAHRWAPSVSWKTSVSRRPTAGALARRSAGHPHQRHPCAHSHGRGLDPGGLGELRWRGAQRHSRTQTRLAQYSALLDRRDALAEAERSAKSGGPDAPRYQAGRESFLADLQATRTYTDVRAQLAAANSQVAMGQIGVFLALGGGWKGSGMPLDKTSTN